MLDHRFPVRFALLAAISLMLSSCASEPHVEKDAICEISEERRGGGYRAHDQEQIGCELKPEEKRAVRAEFKADFNAEVQRFELALNHYLSGSHPYDGLRSFVTVRTKPPKRPDLFETEGKPWPSTDEFRLNGFRFQVGVKSKTPEIVKRKLVMDFHFAQLFPGGIFHGREIPVDPGPQYGTFPNFPGVEASIEASILRLLDKRNAVKTLATESRAELNARASSQWKGSRKSRSEVVRSEIQGATDTQLILNVIYDMMIENKMSATDLNTVFASYKPEPLPASLYGYEDAERLILLLPLEGTRDALEKLISFLPQANQVELRPLVALATPAASVQKSDPIVPPAKLRASPDAQRKSRARK